MMIVTHSMEINGKWYTRTYSDQGLYIERDGVQYEEAIDPVGTDRVYVETETYIEGDADEQDYLSALNKMGVRV